MSVVLSVLDQAEKLMTDFRAVFLSAGAPPMVQPSGSGVCVPIETMRAVTNADVSAAYQECLSETSIKVVASARKTDRRGSIAVSIRGKGRYRVDWYHQRSSLSMSLRPVAADSLPWANALPDAALDCAASAVGASLLVWVHSPEPRLSHLAMDGLFDRTVKSGRWSKLIKVDSPLRYLHPSHAGTLAEQIEVSIDCESVEDAALSVIASGCDGVFFDVPWMAPQSVHSAINAVIDEGIWVVARARDAALRPALQFTRDACVVLDSGAGGR